MAKNGASWRQGSLGRRQTKTATEKRNSPIVNHGPAMRTGMPQTFSRVIRTTIIESPTVGAMNQLQSNPRRGRKRLTMAWPINVR